MQHHEFDHRLKQFEERLEELLAHFAQALEHRSAAAMGKLLTEFEERLEAGFCRDLRAIEHLLREIIKGLRRFRFPAVPSLVVTFTHLGASMNAILVATIPTTRLDGSTLAPTDIASITFQKTSLGADGVTPGPQVVLATNAAAGGAGLTDADLTYTDASSVAGDSYTCFVTDTAGDAGEISNAVTAVAAPPLSAPSAPVLTGTFS